MGFCESQCFLHPGLDTHRKDFMVFISTDEELSIDIYILPFFISIFQFLAAWILGTQEQEVNSFTHPSHVPLEKRKEELWDHLFPSLISSLTGIQCLAGQFLAQYNLFSNNLLFLLPTKSSPLLYVKVTESKLREQLTWFHINSLDYLFKETDIVLLSNLQLA